VKIAFVGAGSYVFGPSILVQLFRSGLEAVELRLIDPNGEAIGPLASAASAKAKRDRRDFTFPCFDSIEGALDGVDAVIHSAAPGMRQDFQRSKQVLSDRYPSHLLTEFGGVNGIAYSVRQAKFTAALSAEILRSSPDANLLISANPLPRTCTAATRLGVDTIGFCSVAIQALRPIGRLLFGLEEDYPFPVAASKVRFAVAGTNHLSWVVELVDRSSGEDLLPALRSASLNLRSKSQRYLASTGFLPAAGDGHISDFLPVEGDEPLLESSSHGSGADRARRIEVVRDVAAGKLELEVLDEHPSWEAPIAFLWALNGGPPQEIVSLNLANRGQIPEVPMGVVVETTCSVSSEGVVPRVLNLPAAVSKHNLLAAEITEAIVDSVLSGDEDALRHAVDLDPTIEDKDLGWSCLREILQPAD
jgi:alpha-galactosidase/6-phospho-beta-glucosidase family protein